jgi:hypothetical protein
MKAIKYPLEGFVWNLYDALGDACIEIRDADKNHVFSMKIKGREMQTVERLKNELVPKVVALLNNEYIISAHVEQGKGFFGVSLPEKIKEVQGKRGRK